MNFKTSKTFIGLGFIALAVCGFTWQQHASHNNHSGHIFRHDPSEKYLKLKELLANNQWKDANTAIAEIALDVTGRNNEGWIDANAASRFPCPDLHYIDNLMMVHSDGQFGLSAQREVYQQLQEATTETDQSVRFEDFAERVGWFRNGQFVAYQNLVFEPQLAPKGQLPVKIPDSAVRIPFKSRDSTPDRPRSFDALIQRLDQCTPKRT